MYNLLENIFASKELYLTILAPVCEKYDLSHTDLMIILCLANNPQLDTATDIIKLRKLTKSAVSMSVRTLQDKGLIAGEHLNGNHRSIHLSVCESALPIVEEGKAAQDRFFSIISDGFTDGEKEQFKSYFERITANIHSYNKAHK